MRARTGVVAAGLRTTLPAWLVVALALAVAAFATAGGAPLRGALEAQTAQASVIAVDGQAALNGAASVLFDAAGLVPGDVRVAQIRVQNSGAQPGTFTLSPAALTDLPAGLPAPLSSVLELTVQDATNRLRPVTLSVGTLAALGPIALGDLDAGESRTYRFEVRWPAGRSAAQDDPLQGASASVELDWDSVAVAAGTPTATARPLALTRSAAAAEHVANAPRTAAPSRRAVKRRSARRAGAPRRTAKRRAARRR